MNDELELIDARGKVLAKELEALYGEIEFIKKQSEQARAESEQARAEIEFYVSRIAEINGRMKQIRTCSSFGVQN
ncbi:hypothetical protein [endosymbiont of Lamellibrachia barhami]|uniref:hypothetical protein n=1 Tax=endosymbiont of Lamellibrachia barhami TaxID=205975 RepID=UPI0015ADB17A|nr:hypothetical protein [endosymbiont of Lamellibrachia barhami]